MKVGIVLLNYKDYAERFLDECLSSIRNLDADINLDLFIVDNASTEKTINYLKDKAPEARLIVNANNDGFAKGNNDALRIMLTENYDYALLLNMDASLLPSALKELLSVAENNLQAGAIQARLMLAGDKERINSLGNVTHFLGFGYCLSYQAKFVSDGRISASIAYPSGACVLLRMKALGEVGLFDERLWMYNEDQDLGWRLWLQNWECVVAFEAVAYHHYEFSRSIGKYYWLERNRLIVAWKNYSTLSLILFFPALVVMEIALLIFSFRSGWFKEKIKSWLYFFNPFNWFYLIRARRLVQKSRKRPDHLILTLFSGTISFQEIDNVLLKYIANPIFNLYFKLMRLIIKSLKK
jgi:GT2 family glycosyltransferase